MELIKTLRKKEGAFFSADALIALVIILSVVMITYPISNYVRPESDINSDLLNALSIVKVSDIDNDYVRSLILSGEIRDLNKSLLEQMGEFYVKNPDDAIAFASAVLTELNSTENIGLWFDKTLIFSNNRTPIESARDVDTARQVITGIEAGQNITGFSARAFLSSDYRSKYFYFGGYVGDGDISVELDYSGNITSFADMELVINKDFDLYVNGNFSGSFSASPAGFIEPAKYNLSTAFFNSGKNLVEFRGDGLFIAGGFIKINYVGVGVVEQSNIYHFPGVDGLINLYDGFYVPGNLTAMNLSLHLNTNYTFFMNIGNTTVYGGTTAGEQTIFLNDAFLSSVLNYNAMEGKIVPLRLGLENATYEGITQKIDVFSVTDLSGSMDDNCGSCSELTCSQTSCGDSNGCKICDAKSANNLLIDFILNTTGNQVGLVGYETVARDSDYHALSDDSSSLKAEVASWDADGNTCICCGINKAMQGFVSGAQQQEISGGLILYYDFNDGVSGGTVLDKSGEGNTGYIVGSPLDVSGIDGGAFKFNPAGTNYVALPSIITSNEGSISFWVDPDRDDSETIFDASSGSKYFFVDIDGGESLRFDMEDSNDADFQDADYSVHDIHTSGWHHVVAVWRYGGSSPSTSLYFDGNLVGIDNDLAGGIPTLLAPFIGQTRSNYQTTWDYEGNIDEFRIYNKALNLGEVQGLFDQTPTCGDNVTEVGEVCDGPSWCDLGGGDSGTALCSDTCDGFLSCTSGSCGDGIPNVGEECDDGNDIDDDECSACELEDRFRSMVVLSDGQANERCSEQGTGNARQDAILASQQACENYGIVVHAVGFGSDADETTLTQIADNGCNGSYYYSDATNLTDVYEQIAKSILTEYVGQTLSTTGSGVSTKLYPDSYINFVYDEPEVPSYGLVIAVETPFDDENGGTFLIPANAVPIKTRVASYSSSRWTSQVLVNNNSVFNLNDYGPNYIHLGDPYFITVDNSLVLPGTTNFVNVTTGVSPLNKSAGSAFDKIITTIGKNASVYTDVLPAARGCKWTIQLEDGSILANVSIPDSYDGDDFCFFTNETTDPDEQIGYDYNDAYKVAVRGLLAELDLDSPGDEGYGKIDVLFTEQDLKIALSEVEGIPFSYSTEVEVRRWA